jgi:hypothetical protein
MIGAIQKCKKEISLQHRMALVLVAQPPRLSLGPFMFAFNLLPFLPLPLFPPSPLKVLFDLEGGNEAHGVHE